MSKINGQYIFNKGAWGVRYKVEDGDEQYYEQVMLHPNHTRHAKENQMGWFIIRDCPNLKNSGTWEPMAIVVQSDNLEEAAEKIKGQEMFKKLNDHAMSVLIEAGSIPEPEAEKEPKPEVVEGFNKWQEYDFKKLKKINMKEKKSFWDWNKVVDLLLIAGIVFLAANDKDGWGWLIFVFLVKNSRF
jgi:hypothetical protein